VSEDDGAEPSEATKREGVGKGVSVSRKTEAQHHARLERGTLVGRYVAIDVLGKGGMGVVYAAFDPELDRKVAVKLLQAETGVDSTSGDQAWLLREAQAMARLAHPNVIAVHDVGTLPGDRVFVAMELVDGPTLRAWLREKRSWREVIDVMRQAGAGLAAAHAAGLVHRDFKPDNVLVGTDGRVRVMDFGLARLRREDESGVLASRNSDLEIEIRSPLSEDLTIAGMVVGTPAYMAPELYKGAPADARSDQFSFGVALYEAMFRVRPYAKGAFYPIPDVPPAPRTPPDTGVPAKVMRVVMRAINADPAARYPTMDALLDELAIDPLIHRKRIAIGAAAMVAAIGVGTGGYLLSHHEQKKAEPCLGIDQRLAGVWDGPIKAAVNKAYTASGQAFSSQAYAGLSKALDTYANEWTATATESCRATRIRGDQPETVLALRQDCLDQRLEELRAFTQLEQNADASLVEKGDKPVWDLEPISKCSNVAALREPGAIPPAQLPKVAEVRKLVAEAKADLLAGRPFPGLLVSQKAADLALPLNNDSVSAEVMLTRGGALLLSGQGEEGVKAMSAAVFDAVRARRDDIISGASISAAIATTDMLGKPGEAQIFIGLARASAAHLGVDHPLEHRMLLAEGVIAAQIGDDPTAIAAHEKALQEAELEYGHDSLALWADEEALGATYTKAGAYVKALPHFERSLKMREASVGPDHPDVALLLSNLGVCYRHAGMPDKAHAVYDRALAIREKAYGANSPMLIPTLNNYADLMKEIDPAATLPVIQRALTMAEHSIGKNHPLYHTVATTYAETLAAGHQNKEARAAFDEVIALETDSHSPLLPTTLTSKAQLAIEEKQYNEAVDLAQRAVAGLESAGGKENPELWLPLSKLGIAKLALGQRDAAKETLDRAIAIAEHVKVSEAELGPTRDAAKQLQ
jgi:tetratricopeptide (TPR) repeat protein